MFPMLAGYKTYIVASLMVMKAVYGMYQAYTTGEVLDVEMHSDSIKLLLEGLGFATVRAGIAKGPKV